MDDFDTSLVITGLFDADALLQGFSWEKLAEGVFTAPLYSVSNDSARAALLHYLPGTSVGSHLHAGFEHIIILHGSQQDGDRLYEAGTLVIHKPGSSHRIYSPSGCIALGIWEKPVKFIDPADS